jgi:hypothetical protein
MRLSELRGRRSQAQTQAQPQSHPQESLGVIRSAASYQRPIQALYQGQAVTLVATGDIVGMSPAVQIVDDQGRLDWVSSDDITVTQHEFLPQAESTRARLRQQSAATQLQQSSFQNT